MSTTPKLRTVDLCAGTAGFSIGLEATGRFETVFGMDLLPEARKIFSANFQNVAFQQADLMKFPVDQIPTHDVCTAGIPCQSYSSMGNKGGINDPRGQVFYGIVRILSHHKPRFAILENVRALLTFEKGQTFSQMRKDLGDIGYQVKYKVLDTHLFTDIPQRRKRLYIMCFRDQADFNRFEFPADRDPSIPLRPLIDFIDKDEDVPEICWYKPNGTKHWRNIQEFVNDDFHEHQVIYCARRQRVERSKPMICPTILRSWGSSSTTNGMIRLGDRVRRLTFKELFKLQGFDVSQYRFPEKMGYTTLCRLAGNAISVPVVQRLGEVLKTIVDTPNVAPSKTETGPESTKTEDRSKGKPKRALKQKAPKSTVPLEEAMASLNLTS